MPSVPDSGASPLSPGLPNTADPNSPANTPPGTPDFTSAGDYKGTTGRANSVFSGTGLGGGVTGDPILTSIFTPLVIPGLFNSTTTQSALPADRVFFDYGYFDSIGVRGVGSSAPQLIRTTTTTPDTKKLVYPDDEGSPYYVTIPGTSTTVSTIKQSQNQVAGFNLNTFNIGVEKTFLNGLGSVYVSVPFLYASNNISGQAINGLGDINSGFKVILYQNLQTGTTLTGGFTVSFPTAHAARSVSYIQTDNGDGNSLVQSTTTSINPTFLQPWLASLLIFDRLYVHQYLGTVVPTDPRVATFLNYDFTVGYLLYRSNVRRFLTSLTSTANIHTLIPLTNRGTPAGQGGEVEVPFVNGALPPAPAPTNFTFSDQVFASGGFQLGITRAWTFSANVVVPLAAPQGYVIGGTFGLTYFY